MSVFAPGSTTTLPSSWGAGMTTFGPQFDANSIIASDRTRMLEWRSSYYDGTCHDWKQYDFDGRMLAQAAKWANQPMLATAPPTFFVPLRMRKPSNPYRLGRMMVNAHTTMLFGNSFPEIRVSSDPRTQGFAQAVAKAARLQAKMIQARTVGGSAGTVGMSWCVEQGKPKIQVHRPQHLYVHEWEDRDELTPRHVTKIYRYSKPVWNEAKGVVETKWYWYRRDWTPVADVGFVPIEFDKQKNPVWVVDEEDSAMHDDGECHFVWIQNWPSEDIDGLSDYDSLEDNLESLDILNSLMSKSLGMNMDPTVILKMDPMVQQFGALKKGSEHAIVVGEGGDASYMEIAGTSIQVGLEKLQADTKHVLGVAACVITDPTDLAAQGLSSVAIRAIYGPMIARKKIYEAQYGECGVKRLLEQIVRSLQKRVGKVIEQVPEVPEQDDQESQETSDQPPNPIHPGTQNQDVGSVTIKGG